MLCNVVPLNMQVNFVHVSPSCTYTAMKYCQSFKLPQNFTLLDGTKPKQSFLHKLPAQTIQELSRIVEFCICDSSHGKCLKHEKVGVSEVTAVHVCESNF